MEKLINKEFEVIGTWENYNERRAELEKEGYRQYGDSCYNTFVKETEIDSYISQADPKEVTFLSEEPRGFCNDSRTYQTRYYKISRETYDRMKVKPQLHEIVRPERLYNFDGFVETTQRSKRGLGWVEHYQSDFYTIKTNFYFVV